MRSLLGICVAALALAGCFTQIRRVPPTWDHATEPDCTAHYGWVAGDYALAAVAAGVGLTVSERTSSQNEARVEAVTTAVVALGFAIAGGVGAERVDECVRAKETLHVAPTTALR